ncbi:hypothetical protein NLJ89_g11577 [Agrocybe chaxingu]|uniref:Uncharacterized protein n=1 Tax=Agrocybe chaxingu TaxID=84603 RepID=A0A9W8MP89_9AGAR|nr:hypothetical protein NLJ89_g11577 [Agrocybe chaxingu]
MLFRVPQLVVPGVIVHDYEASIKKVGEEEWRGLLDSLNLLTSRPNWIQLIASVWEMIEDERWQSLKQMVARVKQDYHALADISRETLLQIFEYRGSCRICMLRLIATITHLPNCGLSEGDLLTLLRISNTAVRPVKKMHQISSEADTYTYIENALELFRKPLYSVFTQDEVEPPLQVADEPVLGPTAHTRLLTLLAERNALQKISKLAKLPKGVSSRATLADFKRMTSPEGVQQFLTTATKRVTARREEGHKRFREKEEMDYACIAYFTAAELAAALVAFDRATDGLYRNNIAGMRREVVLCLGNAAEMALLLKQFQRALYLATGSVEAAERLPSSGGPDSIDKSITEKNQRRVERARVGLGLLPMPS